MADLIISHSESLDFKNDSDVKGAESEQLAEEVQWILLKLLISYQEEDSKKVLKDRCSNRIESHHVKKCKLAIFDQWVFWRICKHVCNFIN